MIICKVLYKQRIVEQLLYIVYIQPLIKTIVSIKQPQFLKNNKKFCVYNLNNDFYRIIGK